MLRQLVIAAIATTLVVSVSFADGNKGTVKIEVKKASIYDGKGMYGSYCAPCHGLNGRGNGPVASFLKTQPADLTLLARANNGKFPSAHIVSVLQFGARVPAHGSIQMPVWGPIFGQMKDSALPSSEERQMRASNLTEYLQTLQLKEK